jgi:hypothetical protein
MKSIYNDVFAKIVSRSTGRYKHKYKCLAMRACTWGLVCITGALVVTLLVLVSSCKWQEARLSTLQAERFACELATRARRRLDDARSSRSASTRLVLAAQSVELAQQAGHTLTQRDLRAEVCGAKNNWQKVTTAASALITETHLALRGRGGPLSSHPSR